MKSEEFSSKKTLSLSPNAFSVSYRKSYASTMCDGIDVTASAQEQKTTELSPVLLVRARLSALQERVKYSIRSASGTI